MFLRFRVLVANPKSYFIRWPIPLLVFCWNREKTTKRGSLAAHPLPPTLFEENYLVLIVLYGGKKQDQK